MEKDLERRISRDKITEKSSLVGTGLGLIDYLLLPDASFINHIGGGAVLGAGIGFALTTIMRPLYEYYKR